MPPGDRYHPRMTTPIADLRRDYARATLHESDVDPDPVRQFERWFAEAQRAAVVEPNAMTLATAEADGRPSARMVLLKGVDARGFVFYSDYRSRKAGELERRWAALAAEFSTQEPPLPPHWGGYRVTPDEVEFWQGRSSRLHDRIAYRRVEGDAWRRARLSP